MSTSTEESRKASRRGKRVYIAGPLTNGANADPDEIKENLRTACELFKRLMESGYEPLCPHLTMYAEWEHGCKFHYVRWIEQCLAWVRVSDAIAAIIPGSSGTESELDEARRFGIPVWYFHRSRFSRGNEEGSYEGWGNSFDEYLISVEGKKPAGSQVFRHTANSKTKDPFAGSPAVETILDEAARLTSKDRNQSYGDFPEEAEKIAVRWSQLLGTVVEARDVPMMMMDVKLVREAFKHKRDNLCDLAGYAHLKQQIEDAS